MEYLSQLRKGEFIYYIDLTKTELGIQSSKILEVTYEHEDETEWGCGMISPSDLWSIKVNINGFEKYIRVTSPNIKYQYFDFKDMENNNGRVAIVNYHYIVSGDKKILINTLKNDFNKSLNNIEDKITKLETEIDLLKNSRKMLLNKIENINKY